MMGALIKYILKNVVQDGYQCYPKTIKVTLGVKVSLFDGTYLAQLKKYMLCRIGPAQQRYRAEIFSTRPA